MSAYPVAYNGSATGTGGDSLTEDLNIYYNVRSARPGCPDTTMANDAMVGR